ncbi:two-component system sporulation sensor kinase B [Bacillus oleivorans]|uniref:histidine kinase n=1 Tax=Bacillus oleivorans TaxID=1448271 RepID=A0A285D563_9BACI|nr:HAMP domain-containing sensor histidine kinase [Bacillus oleivorans]SNX74428.1 two-component system sporulation sensor kinase B [Bacillus oleivorans]
MELTIHFFFNLSLIMVLLFVGVLWSEKLKSLRSIQITAAIIFILSLVICLLFTYPLHESYFLDLRLIPIIIGGLYMGLGPILAAIAIGLRAIYGLDSGFLFTAFYFLFIALLCFELSPWFLKKSSRKRILLSVIITFLLSLPEAITLILMDLFYPVFDVWFAYAIIQPLGVGMIAYFIEEIDKSILLRQHVIKAKRLEAVEQMGAAISHEIRNPLTAAIGFVQLLQDHTLSEEKRTQYLSILKNELQSAERVIQDYLTFSKPQINVHQPFNIHDELKHVVQLLEPTANRNSVQIVEDFSMWGTIEGDPQKFHQCMVNIMKNAIEAMPNGGILTVETKTTSSKVMIRIQDTGSGMSREQIDRLGEPYYSTKGDKGTGLGLMVVYSIARAMKGTIHVESEPGAGTTFELTFRTIPSTLENPETKEASEIGL